MSIAQPTRGGAAVEGTRVVFWMEQGKKRFKIDMPPRAAMEMSAQLEKAAKDAKQNENIVNAARGRGRVT